MKKNFKCLLILSLFFLFTSNVYASFTYDIIIDVNKTNVEKGSLSEIKVSLGNINGKNTGIAACEMQISFDNNILLNSKIRSLNGWSMLSGVKYTFDTGDFVFDKSDMFVIPVKVNGNGSVKIFNVLCSDGENMIGTNDKEIKFTVFENNKPSSSQGSGTTANNNNNNNNNNNSTDKEDVIKDSNANLSSIILSEGNIVDFDPNIMEYEIEVGDFSKLEVTPELESDKASAIIDRNVTESGNNVVITVTAENGDTKVYTIYVSEKTNGDIEKTSKDNNIYVPIFIGIIVILVIINIVRIVGSNKKQR